MICTTRNTGLAGPDFSGAIPVQKRNKRRDRQLNYLAYTRVITSEINDHNGNPYWGIQQFARQIKDVPFCVDDHSPSSYCWAAISQEPGHR